ncbi:protein disulfide-isomerase A4 [Lingula anatina]|uniref:Protein disulfide-isomerase n=1 Tax=Lingula anatina TaxID=7574 RepID=A0A1S3I088_LINAN|nr:protein disulfide-isomerase A4 [Lingula anatina]|eukprot:XP_013391677.1 protein disulfide-isomerase A4 [Lingula anatina]
MKIKVLILCFLLLDVFSVLADDEATKTDDEPEEGEDIADDAEEEEPAVFSLNEKNFDDAIASNEMVLVEFFAPWCGHCKSLAPEYEKAAKRLKNNDPPVVLAAVDATVESDLAQKYDVSGYPTLKWFKKGQQFDYDGPRHEDGIVQYMQERADPKWKPPPEAVVTLTKDNFHDVVDKEELILVEFYAPWCGHCKRLAPEYERAAQDLQKNDPPIILAKVDATVETELAKEYGVEGYPTLKMFRKGKAMEYKGERNQFGIVEYMKTHQGPGSKEMKTLKELKNFMSEDDVTVVGFFNSEEDEVYKTYQESCDEIREDYKFAHTFDEASRNHYKVNAGSVVVFNAERFYTKYEPKWHILSEKSPSVKDLQAFYEKHQLPLVGHMTRSQESKRWTKRPLCVIYFTVDWSIDHRDATNAWRLRFADIAKEYPDITFAVADEEDYNGHLKDFQLDDSGEELAIGCFDSKGKRYAMEPMEEYEADDFKEFLDKFQKGAIKPVVKSQPVVKQKGPVKVVVGKNFEEIVLDKKKDVLIELYAPWCGHCKNLEPKYKELAKKVKKEKNLVIAKLDATANDVPTEYVAEGFPTIYFAPANNKDKPIKYESGNREPEDFISFMKQHASAAFKSDKDEL